MTKYPCLYGLAASDGPAERLRVGPITAEWLLVVASSTSNRPIRYVFGQFVRFESRRLRRFPSIRRRLAVLVVVVPLAAYRVVAAISTPVPGG